MKAAHKPARSVPAVTVVVPMKLALEMETLIEKLSARTGEPLEDVRRAVEVTVLQRGIESLKAEEERQK